MTTDGWVWFGCGHKDNGWMGMVEVWPQWQFVDGHGLGVVVMDGLAWLWCDHNNHGWMSMVGAWPQRQWMDGCGHHVNGWRCPGCGCNISG